MALAESKNNNVAIVRLDQDATTEAKAILVNAYKNEPTFQYLFQSEKSGYEQRVRASVRELFNLHFSNSQDIIGLTLDGNLIATAMIGSSQLRVNMSKQFSWRVRMMLTAGMDCTWRYINYHKQIHKCLPANEHNELPLMGVDPRYQGRGFGRQMLQAIEDVCRENAGSNGIGLDTGNPQYIKFYESLGYETVGEVKLGVLNQTVMFKRLS